MPDYATGTAPDGFKGRRPFQEYAGEVTRKKKAKDAVGEETEVEKPPAFNGRKIGGAKNMLRKYVETLKAGASDGSSNSQDSLVSAGVRINDLSLEPVRRKTTVASLAAPVGKRRIWYALDPEKMQDLNSLPGVWVSKICRTCLINDVSCSGWEIEDVEGRSHVSKRQIRCRRCLSEGRLCHRMVEFTPSQLESVDSKVMKDFLQEVWELRVGSALEIASHSVDGSIALASRRSIESSGTATTEKSSNHNSGKAGPTYSQVRGAYEWLAEQRYHDQCLQPGWRGWGRRRFMSDTCNGSAAPISENDRPLTKVYASAPVPDMQQLEGQSLEEIARTRSEHACVLCLRMQGQCLGLHTEGHRFAAPPPGHRWHWPDKGCQRIKILYDCHVPDLSPSDGCLSHGAWCLGLHNPDPDSVTPPDGFSWQATGRACLGPEPSSTLAAIRQPADPQLCRMDTLNEQLNSWLTVSLQRDADGLARFYSKAVGFETAESTELHSPPNCRDLVPDAAFERDWIHAERVILKILNRCTVAFTRSRNGPMRGQLADADTCEEDGGSLISFARERTDLIEKQSEEVLLNLKPAYEAAKSIHHADMQSVRHMIKAREDYINGILGWFRKVSDSTISSQLLRMPEAWNYPGACPAWVAPHEYSSGEASQEEPLPTGDIHMPRLWMTPDQCYVLRRVQDEVLPALQAFHASQSDQMLWELRLERKKFLRDLENHGLVDVERFWRFRCKQRDRYRDALLSVRETQQRAKQRAQRKQDLPESVIECQPSSSMIDGKLQHDHRQH